ncbi:MAG TPA: GIY-YIG nuclease family protein [Hyphomicrobiaceae bacterium]
MLTPGHPKQPCVYILASSRNGILYVGVTSNLFGRVSLHKQDLIDNEEVRRPHARLFRDAHDHGGSDSAGEAA